VVDPHAVTRRRLPKDAFLVLLPRGSRAGKVEYPCLGTDITQAVVKMGTEVSL
jgi:hypothetical protein